MLATSLHLCIYFKKDDEVRKSEIIDTTDISKIPKEMLEELSNGKGDDD